MQAPIIPGISQDAYNILAEEARKITENGEGGIYPVTAFIDMLIRSINTKEFQNAYASYQKLCAAVSCEKQAARTEYKKDKASSFEREDIEQEESDDLDSICAGASEYGYTIVKGRDLFPMYAHTIGSNIERLFQRLATEDAGLQSKPSQSITSAPAVHFAVPAMPHPPINPNNVGESLPIRIKYLSDIEPIGAISIGDWIDLRAAEEVSLNTMEYKKIRLGIAMQLPTGYEAHVKPRSSTFEKFGIIQANHVATIDESYCGDNDEWLFPAIALRSTTIHKNDRICQFRIVKKQPKVKFEVVDSLGNADRGGFGTTGTN